MSSYTFAYCDQPLEDHVPDGDCPGYLMPPAPYQGEIGTEVRLSLDTWDDADFPPMGNLGEDD